VAENSTDDEKTVEKLAEQRKRLWARRENNGDEAGGRENGCTLQQKRKRLWARRDNNGDETGGRENGCTLRQKVAPAPHVSIPHVYMSWAVCAPRVHLRREYVLSGRGGRG
jgi:hypothetical protein